MIYEGSLMNLELNKLTGNLFINKSEFFFYNAQYISHNIFFKALKSLQSPKNFWKKLRCKLIK